MERTRGRAWAWLMVILAASAAPRLWYVLELPGQGTDRLYSDMHAYDYSGWQMARGLPVTGEPGFNGFHPLSASTYYYAGYTYFVAALYTAFGHEPEAVRLAQALLGTATAWLVYLVAAALTASYLPLVYYEGLILSETWFIFLQMAALALWLSAWGATALRRGKVLAALAGVVAGLACLSRTAFLAGVAALAAGAVVWPPVATPWRRRLALAGLFLGGAAVVIVPVTVRNYQIHRRFILISTNGPSTFLTGHVIHSWSLPPDLPSGVTDAQMAAQHRIQIRSYLADHWREYLAEIPEYFAAIWLSDEFWPAVTPVMSSTEVEETGQTLRVKTLVDDTGGPFFARITHFPDLVRYNDRVIWLLVGLPLGLLAVLFLPRHHRLWSVLYLALLPYAIIPFLAPPFGRYRMPAVPLAFVLAGQALVACWSRRGPDQGPGAASRGPTGL